MFLLSELLLLLLDRDEVGSNGRRCADRILAQGRRPYLSNASAFCGLCIVEQVVDGPEVVLDASRLPLLIIELLRLLGDPNGRVEEAGGKIGLELIKALEGHRLEALSLNRLL